MIYHKCNKCNHEYTKKEKCICEKCKSEDISIDYKKSYNEFICKECEQILQIPLKESEGYWNWKCPDCQSICPTIKNINFNMPSNQVKIEKLKEFKVRKPALNYMNKTYGDELNRPLTEFKKKKR
jgi:hypothetical protein